MIQLKDRLANIFPKNPTQNVYKRFFEEPSNRLDDMVSLSMQRLNREMEQRIKTRYHEILEDWNDRYI